MSGLTINLKKHLQQHWSDQEIENAAIITDFMQQLMNEHNFDYVLKNFNNNSYKQHNRGIAEGVENLVNYVAKFAKQFPDYTYDVKHIYVDGEYVIFHSHVTVKKAHRGNDKKGFNIMDSWRVQDGRICEHWDAIQPLDAFMRFYVWLNGGKILNKNGVF